MPDTLLDFTKICRCCLQESTTNEEMVFLDGSSEDEGSLSNMITTCTLTKVRGFNSIQFQLKKKIF